MVKRKRKFVQKLDFFILDDYNKNMKGGQTK